MKKACLSALLAISITVAFDSPVSAQEASIEYPYYLLDKYNPDDNCWKGMDIQGRWPVRVIPEELLVGPPPSAESGVTLPIDHWVELKFRGRLTDGPGDDVWIAERDPVGEQALVFVTDGHGQEYLLGLAEVPNTGGYGLTEIGFDLAGIILPFVPSTVRILGIDLRGGSPGFDLAYAKARTTPDGGSAACNPSPPDGVKNVPINTLLSWSSGNSAKKHLVYFSTTFEELKDSATPVSTPTQPQNSDRFNPGRLELGKTYYWRVDEVNDNNADSPWKGNIWKFTTADYLVVDDFESYYITPIHNTWLQAGLARMYLSEQSTLIYRCGAAMSLNYYYNSGNYSEVSRKFSPAEDWASTGAKVLELFFYGKADNDIDTEMYVTIGDDNIETVVSYEGDANDLRDEIWHSWKIDLQAINLDLSNIEHITIGFRGRPSEPSNFGSGTMFFDDIVLHSSMCLEENKPDADFNDDCAVNFDDVQEMAQSWLSTGYNVYPVAGPRAPVAWYQFDGNANDSIGNAHGQLYGSPTYEEGVYGRAIGFDGFYSSMAVSDAEDLFSQITNEITVTFWQYGGTSTHHTDTIFCTNYVDGVYNPAIVINLGCWRSPGRYNWNCGWPWWASKSRLSGNHRHKSEWSQRWNHWAFTKNANTGTMQIFLNGALYDSRTDANLPISGVSSFEIGSGWYGGYDGLLDDFRIYDYALPQAEVVYVATHGTGVFDLPLMLPEDLNKDNRIDFEDFAILANSWLDERLWP